MSATATALHSLSLMAALLLTLIFLSLTLSLCAAKSAGDSPPSSCTDELVRFSPCLSYGMGWVRAEIDDGATGRAWGSVGVRFRLDRGWGRALLAGVRQGRWRRPLGTATHSLRWRRPSGTATRSLRRNSGDRSPTVGEIPMTGVPRPVTKSPDLNRIASRLALLNLPFE
ncbi:hypothetical protein ACLB2K_069236 [Fragaria x ananassa]